LCLYKHKQVCPISKSHNDEDKQRLVHNNIDLISRWSWKPM